MRLDATMEQKKDKDDCVWCQKLHGLNLKGAKPKPLFFRKGRLPVLVVGDPGWLDQKNKIVPAKSSRQKKTEV
jgi:hypothetical protein